ncbi:unnamed protein product [Caenorhabditis auriculariae]|uniref:Uncharacterized protein n=1 Tax=Caenorhabditis auriculariae TaxID=2777116 RepID=A0A8S1H3C2_9PELO|nr:unnamed protein product [Caenorhabditis auriculariae]
MDRKKVIELMINELKEHGYEERLPKTCENRIKDLMKITKGLIHKIESTTSQKDQEYLLRSAPEHIKLILGRLIQTSATKRSSSEEIDDTPSPKKGKKDDDPPYVDKSKSPQEGSPTSGSRPYDTLIRNESTRLKISNFLKSNTSDNVEPRPTMRVAPPMTGEENRLLTQIFLENYDLYYSTNGGRGKSAGKSDRRRVLEQIVEELRGRGFEERTEKAVENRIADNMRMTRKLISRIENAPNSVAAECILKAAPDHLKLILGKIESNMPQEAEKEKSPEVDNEEEEVNVVKVEEDDGFGDIAMNEGPSFNDAYNDPPMMLPEDLTALEERKLEAQIQNEATRARVLAREEQLQLQRQRILDLQEQYYRAKINKMAREIRRNPNPTQ